MTKKRITSYGGEPTGSSSKTHPADRKSGIVVVRSGQCASDFDHGFKRTWGVSKSLSGSSTLSLGHGKLGVGMRANAHSHSVETAIEILKGKARVFFGRGLASFEDVNAGDYITIPADVVHCPETLGDEDMEYVVARASGDGD